MKTIYSLLSKARPDTVVDLGNNNWQYNYNIQEVTVKVSKDKEVTRFRYTPIEMYGKPTYKKCVEAVIRKYISQSEEFDLINSYNSAAFNLLSEEKSEVAGTEYVEYLNLLADIKVKIKEDFKL